MKLPKDATRHQANLGLSHWLAQATLLVLALCIGQMAYAITPTLYGVVKKDRLASTEEMQNIQIIRNSARVAPRLNMPLEMGDEIITDPESTVVMRYPNGSVVYLRPGTHVKIGSLFTFWGELFVTVRGAFEVETEFVAAGAEGTGFLVRVDPDKQVSVIVLDGVIRLESKTRRWRPIFIGKYQKAVIHRQEFPERMYSSEEELNAIQRWIKQVDRVIPQIYPLPTPPPVVWCCGRDGVFPSDEDKCRRSGLPFYYNRREAERYCVTDGHRDGDRQPGWCCGRDGKVFSGSQAECRRAGARFFDDRREAEQRCPMVEGWCCSGSRDVFHETEESCKQQRGSFYASEREAQISCRTPEPGGWCCGRDGKVFYSSQAECRRTGSRFFDDQLGAKKVCEGNRDPNRDLGLDIHSPPLQRGWCCTHNGTVIQADERQCKDEGGRRLFRTKEEAQQAGACRID